MHNQITPTERIHDLILTIRSQKVMLDRDLAEIYGVETKRLNEQVKRNSKRSPADFMFQLTAEEKNEVVAICDHLKVLKYSSTKSQPENRLASYAEMKKKTILEINKITIRKYVILI